MSEWQKTALKKITKKIGSGATPHGGSNSYKEAGLSLIRSQNVLDFRFSTDGLAYIDDDQAKELNNVIVENNDILLNITGDSVARCCIVPDLILPARVNQHVAIIRLSPEKAYFPFIFYWLQSMKEEMLMLSEVGATRKALTKGMIEDLEILLPQLPEQKAIASVLSNLDDKIDLLHRQNKTLEAMAETLFRQWFVEDAQEDWEEYSLSDLVDHLKTNISPGERPNDVFKHYSLPAYDEGMCPLKETGSQILSHKYEVAPWTVLVSKLNPKFPRIWPIGELAGNHNVCSTEFQVFKPKRTSLYGYIYFFLQSKDAKEELIMAASGTSGSHQRVRPDDILNLKTNLPAMELAEQYSELVMPAIKKVMANISQIRTLEKLRDTLLPKLMSGEVRVAV